MDADFRQLLLDHAADGGHVADVDDMGAEAVGPAEQGMAAFLQAHIVVGYHGVDAGHLMPVLQQAAREVKADESGATGDEELHQAFMTFPCLTPLRSQTLRVSMTSGRRATRVA